MDQGHYNCRDYHISPHFAAPVLTNHDRLHQPSPLHRPGESWQELEHRSRSPTKPKFPLLRLPLELRQQILLYLLPRTKEMTETNFLAKHARHFSAVQKRASKGMALPAVEGEAARQTRHAASNVVWQRGNTTLLRVCRQLHEECAELLYGGNTILLFLTYAGIKWRYRFLLASGSAPTTHKDFLDLMPKRYMRLLKRVVVNVDHVDSYTGMIKFNVSGRGLAYGLRQQVQKLVNVLKPDVGGGDDDDDRDGNSAESRHLSSLRIRVSTSNAIAEALDRTRGEPKVSDDLTVILEPLRQLYGVHEAVVTGAVTPDFAAELEASLQSPRPSVVDIAAPSNEDNPLIAPTTGLCVYGNDLE